MSSHVAPPVCVLGLGLIGGSLLRAATAAGRVAWGWNRSTATAHLATADGFDAGDDLVATLVRAQQARALVVVGVPMPAVDAVLAAVATHAPDCPLTDVVSVKAPVAAAVARHGLAARYAGGHPMAGTAESGWAASDPDLFRGAVWVVTADAGTDPAIVRIVTDLAIDVGSVVVSAEPAEHDRAVARISHLPHLLAETLAITGASGGELALRLAAGSFRDGTRVAGTAPDLVRAMCEANVDGLLTALDESIAHLAAARNSLAAHGSVQALVEAGYASRQRYEKAQIRSASPG